MERGGWSQPVVAVGSDMTPPEHKAFKERRPLALRKSEVDDIRSKFPNKLPVIVERYPKERSLPQLDKSKYLVPLELSMCQFMIIIRNRMSLTSSQAFYLMVNNRSLASMSLTMAEIYTEYKEEDGFLYMTYASQEMFGLKTVVSESERLEM